MAGISGFLGENVVPLWAELNFDLKMRTNKTCRIFLASSVDEMKKQRTDFGDFIRDFADIYRPRGVDITLVKCEDLRLAYSGRRTQDMLNDEVAQSDVLVTLFYKNCGKDTVEEFEVGRASLAARNKPIIIVALKNAKARTPELDAFMSKLSDELHMYYWRFGTTDKLHFDFVMWFLQSEFAVGGDPVIVENGMVKVGDLPVAQFSQLPFAANNTEYQHLEQQLTALEKDIEELRQDVADYPENKKFSERLSQKVLAREALQQEFQRQQDALLGAAKRIAELRKQQVSEKLAKAADAFENGQLEVANTYLDELQQEGDRLYEDIESQHEQMYNHIEGLRLQTQTVMADVSIPIGERITQVAAIYAKADKWAAASNYPEEKYAKLLLAYAVFLYDYARYSEAFKVFVRQISLSEKLYGTDHPATASSYNDIGLVYYNQGAYDLALQYFNNALEIYKNVLGEDHPFTASTYSNIGVVYYGKGAYDQALECYQKALDIREKVLGKDHSGTAQSYANIGLVYYIQGAYDQALEYYNKALEINEKILGEAHSDTAIIYDNIGLVFDNQGAYDQALQYFNKALDIRKKVLGESHPYTATSYNNAGLVYYYQETYSKALEYFSKALDIREKVLGEGHPETTQSYINLGIVYHIQGAYAKALDYYSKALEIDEKVLGKDHPSTATDYNNIAWIFYEQGDYKQALEYYEKAFAIFRQKLGEDHPNTQIAKRGIEIVKGKLGEE